MGMGMRIMGVGCARGEGWGCADGRVFLYWLFFFRGGKCQWAEKAGRWVRLYIQFDAVDGFCGHWMGLVGVIGL